MPKLAPPFHSALSKPACRHELSRCRKGKVQENIIINNVVDIFGLQNKSFPQNPYSYLLNPSKWCQ